MNDESEQSLAANDPTANDEESADLLCYAVLMGNLAEVQQLLASGINANAYSSYYHGTALMHATTVEIVDALLQAGADVHRSDDNGMDVLFRALQHENRAVVERLVQGGADLNRRNQHGWTRLRQVVFQRDADGVALLLELGADPALDRGKLLSAASWYGSMEENPAVEEIIDRLIVAGEDVNATDHHSYSALHCAVHDYAHTPSDEEWWNASSDGPDISATRALLKHGANPNLAGSDGKTPLLLAAHASDGELCVEALLAAGADAEKAGSGGITPLMVAALRHRAGSVRILLAHGVDASREDIHRHNALFYAQQSLVSLAEDEEQIALENEQDPEMQAWNRDYMQQQRADAESCIALLEAALR